MFACGGDAQAGCTYIVVVAIGVANARHFASSNWRVETARNWVALIQCTVVIVITSDGLVYTAIAGITRIDGTDAVVVAIEVGVGTQTRG